MQENKGCVLEHNHEYHKSGFDQNAPNYELALSLVLQRGYHNLATHFCGSIILQVFDFKLFQ